MNKTSKKYMCKRGDIFWIDKASSRAHGREIFSNRFGVIVSNDVANIESPVVTVAYLTSEKTATLPTHVPCSVRGKDAIIMCEQLATVDRSRLETYKGTLNKHERNKLDEAIMVSMGINLEARNQSITSKHASYIEAASADSNKQLQEMRHVIKDLVEERDCYKKLYELNN